MDITTIVIMLLPLSLPIVIFIILARKGITKSILIVSFVLASLQYVTSISQGDGIFWALVNSVPVFFFWYCIIEGVRRFVTRKKIKKDLL